MAYSNQIKENAFGYYTTGISFDEITRKLKEKYPEECQNLSRKTIATWEKKYNWPARAEAILRRSQELADAKRISKRAELVAELEELQQVLLRHSRALVPKSLEGTVNSILGLSRLILELRGERGKLAGKLDGKQLDQVIQIIFDVLAADPKIGPLLEQRQSIILQEIQGRLEANGAG